MIESTGTKVRFPQKNRSTPLIKLNRNKEKYTPTNEVAEQP